jgi:hypothetical protein
MKKSIALFAIIILLLNHSYAQYSLFGRVTDLLSNKPISNVEMKLIGRDGSVRITHSDVSGNYIFNDKTLKPTNKYIITAIDSNYKGNAIWCFTGYKTYKVDFSKSENIEINFALQKPPKEIHLSDFHFKPNSAAFLDTNSSANVDSLFNILTENKNYAIELEGQKSSYPDSLGFRRARMIKLELIKKGINSDRIKTVQSSKNDTMFLKSDVLCTISSINYISDNNKTEQRNKKDIISLTMVAQLKINTGDFSNVSISVYQNNNKLLILSSKNNFTSGKMKATFQKDTISDEASDILVFRYDCEYQNEYTFRYQKKGYVTKDIKINTVVPRNMLKDGFDPYLYRVTLFRQLEKQNEKSNLPVGTIRYYEEKDDFDYELTQSKANLPSLNEAEKKIKENKR